MKIIHHIATSALMATIAFAGQIGESKAQEDSEKTTVEWLYTICKRPDLASQNSCSAYLMGSAGVLGVLGSLYQKPEGIGLDKDTALPLGVFGICNYRVTGAALRQVFLNWAEKTLQRGITNSRKN